MIRDPIDSLATRGFVVLRGAVPGDRCRRARRAVNASLGRGLRPEDLPRFRARSFCPELQTADALLDLYRGTAAEDVAEALVDPMGLEPVTTAQIALAFPADTAERARPHPHIDGLYTPANGVPPGSVLSFTMLAGVVLGAADTPGAGHLIVWPGSHLVLARHFRERGPRSLGEGMPDLDYGPPEEVALRAGDAVISHYLLAHAGGSNSSAEIRYAVYFRLKARGHDGRRAECLTDPWREWPGMGPRALSAT